MLIDDDDYPETTAFEKFTHRNTDKHNNSKEGGKPHKNIVFESFIDGFIGYFSNPAKIIEFANNRYGIKCYKDATSKKAFSLKVKGTDKLVGCVFPANYNPERG